MVIKMYKQIIMNGADIQLERLTKLGDPLEGINAAIDWEIFRATIVDFFRNLFTDVKMCNGDEKWPYIE